MLPRRSVGVAVPSAVALCSVLSAGCSPKPASEPAAGGYDGATRSIGAMVASPSRCAFSFIYDDFITERAEGGQASQKKPNVRDAILRGPMHIAGAPVTVIVRGTYSGDAGPIGTLLVEYGDAQAKTELTADGKEIGHEISSELIGRAVSGDNALKVTVTLAEPVDGQNRQRVDIDSMDVAITGAFCGSAAGK
jgi:hypothetical protein